MHSIRPSVKTASQGSQWSNSQSAHSSLGLLTSNDFSVSSFQHLGSSEQSIFFTSLLLSVCSVLPGSFQGCIMQFREL